MRPAAACALSAVLAILVTLLVCGGITFGTHHVDTVLGGWTKIRMQRQVFKRASRRAKDTGKPLLVIGNPRGGFLNRITKTYDCGDACLDINGCTCPKSWAGTHIVADVLEALKTMPTNSHVSFESEVFPYVDDLPPVLAELQRVTGGDMFSSQCMGVRTGFAPGVDINPADANPITHKRIMTHFPPFSKTYRWVETPEFASWLYLQAYTPPPLH